MSIIRSDNMYSEYDDMLFDRIDFECLRSDLVSKYYIPAASGLSSMFIDAWEMKDASHEDLLKKAIELHYDLDKYRNL